MAADRGEQARGNQFTEEIITLLLYGKINKNKIYFEFWIAVFAFIAVTAQASDVRGCQNAEWVNGHGAVRVCVIDALTGLESLWKIKKNQVIYSFIAKGFL